MLAFTFDLGFGRLGRPPKSVPVAAHVRTAPVLVTWDRQGDVPPLGEENRFGPRPGSRGLYRDLGYVSLPEDLPGTREQGLCHFEGLPPLDKGSLPAPHEWVAR